MTTLRWIGESINEGGVTERRFDLERESGTVPGILWAPMEHDRPVPLVLMGHGGSGHKRSDRQLMLGRRLATVSQVASVTIDGPYHGDRVPEQLDRQQYQAMMAAMGVDKVTDGMVDDWGATLDALSQLDDHRCQPYRLYGLFHGDTLWAPLRGGRRCRLRCAVLGKNGLRQTSGMANMAPRFERDAPTIKLPLLYHVQWDDELFPRDGQFELFDRPGNI